jgi:hypothetical protein
MATYDKEAYDVPEYEYDLDENEEDKQNAGANKYSHSHTLDYHTQHTHHILG